MIFKAYHQEKIHRLFFTGYFYTSLVFMVLSLAGFFSGAGTPATVTGILYLLLTTFFSLNRKFQNNPFSILFCFFSLLYLNFPAMFVLVNGENYIFGNGLPPLPYTQEMYSNSLPMGFLYLTVSWLAVWFSLWLTNRKKFCIPHEKFCVIRIKHLFLLGAVVFVVALLENESYTAARLFNIDKLNSMLAFVFFDHAYLVMAGFVLILKLNNKISMQSDRRVTASASLIFFAYVLLLFFAGSKAAVLVIFLLLVLYPFCLASAYQVDKILFPTKKIILFLLILTPFLFYFALIQRNAVGSGINPSLGTLFQGLSEFSLSSVTEIFSDIFYRFSQGGLDRFLLIFQSFIIEEDFSGTSQKFAVYLAKNAANMLLLGTPFPEAFSPSSQLFPAVISYSLEGGEVSHAELLRSANTQPYTIFGVFMVIFGVTAPFFIWVFTSLLVILFNSVSQVFFRISLLYFFLAALSSYGIEVVLGNTAHLWVSMILMFYAIKVASHFRLYRYEKKTAC